MKTGRITVIVRVLLLCLTICQFASAQETWEDEAAPRQPERRTAKKRSAKKAPPQLDRVLATAAFRADEVALEFATSERSDMGFQSTQHQWLQADQTVMDPIPRERMMITSVALAGSTHSFDTNRTNSGLRSSTSHQTTEFGPVFKLSYGLSNYSYISTTVSYLPGHSSFETSGGPLPPSSSSEVDEGWREPQVAVGTSLRLSRRARITAELAGAIPLGNGHSEVSGATVTSNGLEGGAALTPKLSFVSTVGPLKILGGASYTHKFDRHVDWINSGRQTTRTVSGGNLFGTTLGLEFPSAWNLGFAGIYESQESTTTSSFTTTTTSAATDSPVQWGGARVYLGVPIPDTDILILPVATYMSVLNAEVGNMNVARSDDWKFTLRGVIHF